MPAAIKRAAIDQDGGLIPRVAKSFQAHAISAGAIPCAALTNGSVRSSTCSQSTS